MFYLSLGFRLQVANAVKAYVQPFRYSIQVCDRRRVKDADRDIISHAALAQRRAVKSLEVKRVLIVLQRSDGSCFGNITKLTKGVVVE